MARILPRLAAQLQRKPLAPDFSKFTLPRKRPRSLHRPVPPTPSFKAADNPTSILLHDPPNNPITASRVYAKHKTLPPLPRDIETRKSHEGNDAPRAMTREERQFWSSPYLRMIASPIRQCITSHRFLPNDFLIRLAIHRVPRTLYPPGWKRSEPPQTFLPDGLQHTKFTARRSGKAHYVLCSRRAIEFLADPSVKRRGGLGVTVHHLLADQIAHLLRLRVLQELELLADHLESPPPPPPSRKSAHCDTKTLVQHPKCTARLVRRLTQAEWRYIVDTGSVPHPGALAVIVVPPLQKDRTTGLRPEPDMSAAPPSSPPDDTIRERNKNPPWVVYPVRQPEWDEKAGEGLLPQEKIPLYHGPVLFPDKGQRAALHALLLRLLKIEWNSGYGNVKEGGAVSQAKDAGIDGNEAGMGNGKSKSSHAFLLCSDAETVLRGDTAPVAIALWRLRMFEDPGEDIASESTDGWEWTRRDRKV